MNNPLMNGTAQMGGAGNFQQFMQRFQQFQKTFQGNPKEQVQQLLNSGKISQQQYTARTSLRSSFRK